jgi:hypothetical protein
MTVARENHDHHCIMNVDYRPWRIQSIRDGRHMVVAYYEQTRTADLSVLNWEKYCADAAAFLKDEQARLEQTRIYQAEALKRQAERIEREWAESVRQVLAMEQLFASGYGPIDDLEDEVVLVDLEFTDPETVLAVDRQTFHLERLEA